MSADFPYRYVLGDTYLSDLSSSDETGDTISEPIAINSSGSKSSDQDSNNNEKLCSDANRRQSRKKTEVDSKSGLYWNVQFPPSDKLTVDSIPEYELLLPKLEELILDSDSEAINQIDKLCIKDDDRPLAGVVTSVARVMGLIVVKPPMPYDFLLYLGSPVFVRTPNAYPVSKEVAVGQIIDVFGPASEPYYCVKPVRNGIELVPEGTQLFYSPDNPRTGFIRLKQEDNNRFTVLYSPRCPSLVDCNRMGRPDADHFRFSSSTEGSPHLQKRRRRGARTPGFSGYRSKYSTDSRILHPVQPKHSYFSY
ncbi:uncharacterized protein LOC124413680 [Diprion similis]|uniref:uncharacterized protein LOC124413680 n=1 Tax=Diprion similis TaxID=362088 RepID=UPI001EF925D1|nr:uncharacterized protein LOC124413680 [Diprion similis]